jgi:hypothetical protein
MKRVLVTPGWITEIRLFKEHADFDICYGKLDAEPSLADYVIGVSLGALVVLRDIEKVTGKVVLVNPPLPRRSLLVWLLRCIRHISSEGLFPERQTFILNPIRFFLELMKAISLLRMDFSKALDTIPRDRIIIVRGNRDIFYCDDKAVAFFRSKGISVVEYEGGHNISEKLEDTIDSLTT